jgi:succinyl-CoA synthetase beta subunit
MQIGRCTVVVLADVHAREREKGSVRVCSTAGLT